MKVYLFALVCFVAVSAKAQTQNSYPKLTLELGVGYEYANLEGFNQDYVKPIGYGTFLNELHSGWSANLRTPLHLTPAVDIALMVTTRTFRKRDEMSLSATQQEPYNTVLNILTLFNVEGGIESTIYLDQFWKLRREARLNVGIFGSGAFVHSNFRRFEFKRGETEHSLKGSRQQIHHWNTSFGLAMRYRIEDSYFNSIVLNTGFNYATAGEEFNIDLNGYFTRVLIGLGR